MGEESAHRAPPTLSAQASLEDVVQVVWLGRMEDASCTFENVPVERDLAFIDLSNAAAASRPDADAAWYW